MFTLKNYDLSDVNSIGLVMDNLYELFKKTLNPDLTMREFRQYFFGQHPDNLEISFIYRDAELAGFCSSAAYPRKVRGKKIVILRSAFGLLETHKNGKFPLHGLFYKYMRYKLRHLFTPVFVAGFMANPLMYAMICKYTLTCYPRRDQIVPAEVLAFKDDLLESMNLSRKTVSPFVLKIHFQVRFNATDVQRFEASTDKDVQYFLSINPGYREQMGVLVLVPVTLTNMGYTFIKHLTRKLRKMLKERK